jgi:endogenous inhibitor of DNA gyrase (YacG/DUF329 family)
MAIKSYVPPKLKLIDNRSPDGGYYTANCDICGTEYYPKRSNSKYCSPKCGVVSHRMANAGKVVESKKEDSPGDLEEVITGISKVVDYYKMLGLPTYGIKSNLKHLSIGDSLEYTPFTITKLSTSKYKVH